MAVGSLQNPSCLLGSQRGVMHLTDVFCCPCWSMLSDGTGCILSLVTASCCPGPSHMLVCVHVAPWDSFGLLVCFLRIPPILVIQSPLDKVQNSGRRGLLWFSAAVAWTRSGYCACDKDPFEAKLFGFKLLCLSNNSKPSAAWSYTARCVVCTVTRDPETLREAHSHLC